MRRLAPMLWVATLLLVLPWHTADGKPGRKKRQEEPEPPPALPAEAAPLFDGTLPLDLGELPQGLANISSQSCHACHDEQHTAWASSPHSHGPSQALRQLARETDEEAVCVSCHLPLTRQWPSEGTWEPLLASEGVTCATCHVRDGTVIGPRHDVEPPHAHGWRSDLASSETCATCHQMTWPGAVSPLYDTYGEWQRSAWSRAGVGCVDCHMGPYGHDMTADRDRALSILLELDTARLTRGGPPASAHVVLQNTGAGHHVPTGSPWISWRVDLVLVPPEGTDHDVVTLLSHPLKREIAADVPWSTTSDTRLAAGETSTLEAQLALTQEAPAGSWTLRVEIFEEVPGTKRDKSVLTREASIEVQ